VLPPPSADGSISPSRVVPRTLLHHHFICLLIYSFFHESMHASISIQGVCCIATASPPLPWVNFNRSKRRGGPWGDRDMLAASDLATSAANLPQDSLAQLPDDFKTGIYFGWATVDGAGPYKMVSSVGCESASCCAPSPRLSVEPPPDR